METIIENATPLLDWLLKSGVQASVLIFLILLAKIAIRDRLSARWYSLLWLIVLVRMVLPWGIDVGFGFADLLPESVREPVELALASRPEARDERTVPNRLAAPPINVPKHYPEADNRPVQNTRNKSIPELKEKKSMFIIYYE